MEWFWENYIEKGKAYAREKELRQRERWRTPPAPVKPPQAVMPARREEITVDKKIDDENNLMRGLVEAIVIDIVTIANSADKAKSKERTIHPRLTANSLDAISGAAATQRSAWLTPPGPNDRPFSSSPLGKLKGSSADSDPRSTSPFRAREQKAASDDEVLRKEFVGKVSLPLRDPGQSRAAAKAPTPARTPSSGADVPDQIDVEDKEKVVTVDFYEHHPLREIKAKADLITSKCRGRACGEGTDPNDGLYSMATDFYLFPVAAAALPASQVEFILDCIRFNQQIVARSKKVGAMLDARLAVVVELKKIFEDRSGEVGGSIRA